MVVTRSQTRQMRIIESVSLYWHRGLQAISQLSEYVQRVHDVASSQTEHVDIDEGDISSISESTDLEPVSLQYARPAVKTIVSLKSVDHITYQQKAMRPPEDTKLLPRTRKIRSVFKKRRRRLFPSAKPHKMYLASSRTTRFMHSLGLPMLPMDNSTKNLTECLERLRWKITLKPLLPRPIYDLGLFEESLLRKDTLPNLKPEFKGLRSSVPSMKSRPRPPLGSLLEGESRRLRQRFENGSFQISTTWRPLRNIPTRELYRRRQGTINSDPGSRSDSGYGDTDPNEENSEHGSSEDHPRVTGLIPTMLGETMLAIKPSEAHASSISNDWEALVAMQPVRLHWTYQDAEAALFRDKVRRAAIFGVTDRYPNANTTASRAITRLLMLRADDSRHECREEGFRTMAAQFMADVWSQEELYAYCSFQVNCFLASTSSVRWTTKLDVACVPLETVLPEAFQATPVLLAAQYIKNGEKQALEELASAFHTILIIMIVYYLDRRSSVDEDLPSWMVLYGVIFDESGFRFHEFYPVYTDEGGQSSAGWGATSNFVKTCQLPTIIEHNSGRARLISILLRISSRAHEILRRLADWDGYKRIVMNCLCP